MARIKITESDLGDDDYNGACRACGQIQYGGVEPDARNYVCDNCGEKEVFGLPELAIMGELIILPDDEDDEQSTDS